MLPIGPLMIEHRLIERMIRLMDKELQRIKKEKAVNTGFIDVAVDFLRSYADRCHHGKEEDILFRDLSRKQISAEHKRIMDQLMKEHALARNSVKKLFEANARYAKGDKSAVTDITESMGFLLGLYPKHIEMEDKHFFIPCMDYFGHAEKDNMLSEEMEFDRKLFQDKYAKIVEALE